jgi:hypothetical protein
MPKENDRQYLASFSVGIRPPIDIRPPMICDLAAGSVKTPTKHFDKAQESPKKPSASRNRVAWIAVLLSVVAVVISLLVWLWPRACACP